MKVESYTIFFSMWICKDFNFSFKFLYHQTDSVFSWALKTILFLIQFVWKFIFLSFVKIIKYEKKYMLFFTWEFQIFFQTLQFFFKKCISSFNLFLFFYRGSIDQLTKIESTLIKLKESLKIKAVSFFNLVNFLFLTQFLSKLYHKGHCTSTNIYRQDRSYWRQTFNWDQKFSNFWKYSKTSRKL